jgi:hypothetical protein
VSLPTGIMRNLAGKVIFDTSALTWQLVAKGTATIQGRIGGNTNPGSLLVPEGSSNPTRVVAIRPTTFYAGATGRTQVNGQWFRVYATSAASGSADYWIFDISSNLQPSYPGLNLRNPVTGELVYSSDYDMMNVAAVLTTDPLSLDKSRTYAVAQGQFAGHRRPQSVGAYIVNGEPRQIQDNPGNYPSNTVWSYRNDGKVVGCMVGDGTVQSGQISWDDVVAQLGYGSTPPPYPPDWDRAYSALVLDVTGL